MIYTRVLLSKFIPKRRETQDFKNIPKSHPKQANEHSQTFGSGECIQEHKALQEELEKEVTRLDQREKELIQESGRIKKQLASAQEEKRVVKGRLHEIEPQLNAP